MTLAEPLPDPPTDAAAAPPRRVLVVDDSRAQRKILVTCLRRWNYDVVEAASGTEALDYCAREKVDIVLSDWMMPGMSGLEFCQKFRDLPRDDYGYFILLTSKSDKGEIAQGLQLGADDFLTKPVSSNELRARIHAGERILRMSEELKEKNRLVSATLEEISGLYHALDADLLEARKLQQSLVRERHHDFGAARASLLLRPAGRVGGDLVGVFEIDAARIGFYAIDVSGHGIASALMTARLAAYLSGTASDQNVALRLTDDGQIAVRPPADVAAHLNRLMIEEMDTEHYCTLFLGYIDFGTGRVIATQCGHPHPAVQSVSGEVIWPGEGGLPVGLIPGAAYEDFELQLSPGDRLFVLSDGITECNGAGGEMLGDSGLAWLIGRNAHLTGPDCLDALIWDLDLFSGDSGFDDDISAVLIEFAGPGAAPPAGRPGPRRWQQL